MTVAAGETAEAAFALEASAITLAPGWNFISTPKKLAAGADTIALFDAVETGGHAILLYDGLNYRWKAMNSADLFQPLDGIWIYANGTYTIPLTFAAGAPELPPAKDLGKGWNAIGFPAPPPNRGPPCSPGTLDHPDSYDAGGIKDSSSATPREQNAKMQPMQGYWIYMTRRRRLLYQRLMVRR